MGSYSIAIRTLGRAGEKYRRLLDSIRGLTRKPEKIIVVLPHGFSPPELKLGCEQFVFCPKSMIGQRIEALNYISSDFILFLDDDIEFGSDFAEKILKPLEENRYDCSTGPLFSFFPASAAGKIAGTLTASVSVSFFKRDYYVKILRSGGWSYHTFDTDVEHYYPTESFAWTCFAIKTDVMRDIHMEEEQVWLERFGYACGDDRVMAYKLIKRGYKACVVSNALYIHNDARTSTSKDEMSAFLPKFCMYYMHTVFWHRFIFSMDKAVMTKIQDCLCFAYWRISMFVFLSIKRLIKNDKIGISAFQKGVKEGFRYIRADEYRFLKPVREGPSASLDDEHGSV